MYRPVALQFLYVEHIRSTSAEGGVLPRSLKVHVPGKLYLMGEYAVVEGYPAIVMPVDRYVTVSIHSRLSVAEDSLLIGSTLFPQEEREILFTHLDSNLVNPEDPLKQILVSALLTLRYASECGVPLRSCSLVIDSQLDDATTGRKFGLGSSGASMVAVVRALLEFLLVPEPINVSRETLVYKLACLALTMVGDNGSGGDIAACAWGRPLYYIRPQREWLLSRVRDLAHIERLNQVNQPDSLCQVKSLRLCETKISLSALVAADWPGLVIDPSQISPDISFIIGWTGSPASSDKLVSAMAEYKAQNPKDFKNYCRRTEEIVNTFRQICSTHAQAACSLISQAEQAMEDLSCKVSAPIETPKLHRLVETAVSCGFVGKISGAGGGDCGFAAGANGSAYKITRLKALWQEEGIILVDFNFLLNSESHEGEAGENRAESIPSAPSKPDSSLVDDRNLIASRKEDHVRLARAQKARAQQRNLYEEYQGRVYDELDSCEFIHTSLPEISIDQVDISTDLAGIRQNKPFFINAMTGGTELTNEINMKLAQVAGKTGTLMALGSMSILVKKPQVRDLYRRLKQENPQVSFIANLGAEHSPESALAVVEAVDAQALQIHINPAQEIVMPEGSRDFRGWVDNITNIAIAMRERSIPVIAKEVGFGMSRQTAQILKEAGITYIDVAGKGGTNFITIENARLREKQGRSSGQTEPRLGISDFSYLKSWGISTLRSLIEVRGVEGIVPIASGGVRNPLDAIKYLALGARTIGLSGIFLDSVMTRGIEGTVDLVETWQDHIQRIFTLLGVRTIQELQEKSRMVFPASLIEYCRQRGLTLPTVLISSR